MKHPNYLKGGTVVVIVILLLLVISVTGNIGFWLAIGSLIAAGMLMLWSLAAQLNDAIIKPAHRLYSKDFSLKFLASLMAFFLVLGTLLYFYVFHTLAFSEIVRKHVGHEVEFSNAEYLLRSLICSLDLFMLDVDSNILDRLDGHAALKGWLAVQAVMSFACTVAMLVSLVYSRLHSYWRLNHCTKISDDRNHLYLFFGSNEPSELLIKDIVKHDPKAIAVVIDEAKVGDDEQSGWDGIVGFVAHNTKVFKSAEKIGAHVAVASQKLDDIDSDITSRPDFDAFGYLGIPKIRKFIERLPETSDPELHVFFMNDDEELNIRNIIVLAKDVTMLDAAKNLALKHQIYCHARYNGPNRVIQDVALKKHLNIKIVDSSHIAVELLKYDPECHPVNVVHTSPDNPTTVDRPLKTLIIGFGEVGRDAFRFLYEFGAFVDSSDHNRRSRFECTIVDKNLNDIQGSFMSMMPGIFKYHRQKRSFENPDIRFEKVDYSSREFYESILLAGNFLKEVNYIIISIGNNDEAIALGTKIFTQIRKEREDLSDLRIFVRVTDDKKVEGIRKIADHYNYGYGDKEGNVPVIRIFGQPEKTYTYDLVVNDRFIELGKEFHEKYRRIAADGSKTWDERHRELTRTGTPDIDKLRKLRRQESQDRANALHAPTKVKLLKDAMGKLDGKDKTDWPMFYIKYFNPDGSPNTEEAMSAIRYTELSEEENRIILNLAHLEHIRWNAAHELAGYEFNDDGDCCDERTMRHNCLCEWDKLDKQSEMQKGWACDYKKYDFCVVDTTISLNKGNLLHPDKNS